jgi:hypothetical protein
LVVVVVGGVEELQQHQLNQTKLSRTEQLITISLDLCPPFSIVLIGSACVFSVAFDLHFRY